MNMKPNKILALFVLVAFVFSSAFLSPSCNQPKTDDPTTKDGLRVIADTSHRIANAVDSSRSAVRKLRSKELVTNDEALQVSKALLEIATITDTFSEKARKHQIFDIAAKDELLAWVEDLRQANLKLIGDGSYHIRNPTAQASFALTVDQIATLISTITQTIQTLKPAEKTNERRTGLGTGIEAYSRTADNRRMDRTFELFSFDRHSFSAARQATCHAYS